MLEEKWKDVELRFFEIRKDFIILILKFIDINVISNIEIFFVFRKKCCICFGRYGKV